MGGDQRTGLREMREVTINAHSQSTKPGGHEMGGDCKESLVWLFELPLSGKESELAFSLN